MASIFLDSTPNSCSCVPNAEPSASMVCECVSDAVISSEFFNLDNGVRACILKVKDSKHPKSRLLRLY